MEKIQKGQDNMNNKMDQILPEMEKLKRDNTVLKTQVAEQEKRLEVLEREMRRRNLIIKGVKEDEGERVEQTVEKVELIMQKIGVVLSARENVEEVVRIGKQRGLGIRPILIKGIREATRREIFTKTRLLKGTDVWIEEDLPKKVQEERKILVDKMREARRNGLWAVIRYNRLIIDRDVQRGEFNSAKRTVQERSPDGDFLDEQLRKITRITRRKN